MKYEIKHIIFNISIMFVLLFVLNSCNRNENNESSQSVNRFSFIVTADMRQYAGSEYQTSQYFYGACEAIKEVGKGSFMISPGDIDPPQDVYNTISDLLGYDYQWYPVVGNHEAETAEDMVWLRDWGNSNISNFVNTGPINSEETTYSFNYQNTHFIILNEYYDGSSDVGSNGDIVKSLYDWLVNDLKTNTKPFIFIFGHEPIVSIPDYHNGRIRHVGDNLDAHPENSHKFQQLLRDNNVTAYIHGHTHNFSYTKINGLWQIDSGHSRGNGDKGARSTFLKFIVTDSSYEIEVYRNDANGGPYILTQTLKLN